MLRLEYARIEAWALSIVRRVEEGHPVEDARVELKAEWPEASRAARRIAGHANSASGNNILWLIGIDEESGKVSQLSGDIADWWRSVRPYFDGVSPELTEIALHTEKGTVYALYFDTSRAPYVVKNPAHGQPGGGAVALEVPWREGTSVRSANRSDLLQILVPQVLTPTIHVLSGFVFFHDYGEESGNRYEFVASCDFYIIPASEERLIFPRHLQQCEVLLNGSAIDPAPYFYYPSPNSPLNSAFRASFTIECTSSEILVTGPGKFSMTVNQVFKEHPGIKQEDFLEIKVIFQAINSPMSITIGVSSREFAGRKPSTATCAWSIERT